MKFLMFNIVVATALVYLFASGGSEVRTASERAAHAANTLKQKTRGWIGTASEGVAKETAPTAAKTKTQPRDMKTQANDSNLLTRAPAPVRQAPDIKQAKRDDRTAQASPQEKEMPKARTIVAMRDDKPVTSGVASSQVDARDAKGQPTQKKPLPALPTSIVSSNQWQSSKRQLSPEVEKRRAIVLGKSSNNNSSNNVTKTAPWHSKSKVERARQLMLLSEDMELFSAKAIGR